MLIIAGKVKLGVARRSRNSELILTCHRNNRFLTSGLTILELFSIALCLSVTVTLSFECNFAK